MFLSEYLAGTRRVAEGRCTSGREDQSAGQLGLHLHVLIGLANTGAGLSRLVTHTEDPQRTSGTQYTAFLGRRQQLRATPARPNFVNHLRRFFLIKDFFLIIF